MHTYESPTPELQEIGRYSSYSEAVEDGLVILAMGEAYWMFPEDSGYVLCVRASARGSVRRELGEVLRIRNRKSGWRVRRVDFEIQRVGVLSFFLYVLILTGFFLMQRFGPYPITSIGEADSIAMVRGHQWWRAITALTLHADIGHLVGNIAAGAGFGFWLARYLGAAWAWTLIILCGALGNVFTAFLYYPNPHLSIGASTAVFGALGLLAGFGWYHSRKESRRGHSIPEWILPLLAGVTLLGMLGTGGERTDIVAHLCGFGSGILVSIAFSFAPIPSLKRYCRYWIGWVPVVGIVIAWFLALF
jgi:membrane associated rhomboid family serine protease